jgi:hypothetical protein
MRISGRIFLVLTVVLATTTFAPPASALPRDEVTVEYYDECMNLIASHVTDCSGFVWNWGSNSGAKYKNTTRLSCESSGYSSYWYEWDGSQWQMLPGVPVVEC